MDHISAFVPEELNLYMFWFFDVFLYYYVAVAESLQSFAFGGVEVFCKLFFIPCDTDASSSSACYSLEKYRVAYLRCGFFG